MPRRATIPRLSREPRRAIRPSERLRIFRRDRYACQYCGATSPDVRLAVDHVVPLARGGTNDERNLVTACVPCNAGKHAQLILPAEAHRRLDGLIERTELESSVPDDPSLLVLVPTEVHESFPELQLDAAWLAAHCGGTPDGPEAIHLT